MQQIQRRLRESAELKLRLGAAELEPFASLLDASRRALAAGHKLLLFGNGGSAADAQHIAAELVGRYMRDRPGIAAIALTTDTSILTSVGNDYGFDRVFSRQVEGLVGKKDMLLVISTSGNSKNLIEAAKAARKKGAKVFALLGGNGGKARRYADLKVVVPSTSVQRIQEEHIFIIHNLVALIEQDLFA